VARRCIQPEKKEKHQLVMCISLPSCPFSISSDVRKTKTRVKKPLGKPSLGGALGYL
jgi:hypothetical protein